MDSPSDSPLTTVTMSAVMSVLETKPSVVAMELEQMQFDLSEEMRRHSDRLESIRIFYKDLDRKQCNHVRSDGKSAKYFWSAAGHGGHGCHLCDSG